MQEKQQVKLSDQYRAEIELNNTRVTLTGPSSTEIQGCIKNLLGSQSKTRFENHDNTIVVYHESQASPVGWIAVCEVPSQMSVEYQKKQSERAAA